MCMYRIKYISIDIKPFELVKDDLLTYTKGFQANKDTG